MATTNFIDAQTPITAGWLNDVDAHVYDQDLVAHQATNINYTPSGTGAVATNVQTKLREAVSVKDFIPAGVDTATTDCTAYIQAAVAYLEGKRLYVPAGTYLLTKITLPSDIEIFGDGAASVLKLKAAQNDHLLYATGKTGITLRDLVLDGNKSNQTVGAISRCFYTLDSSDIRLENVIVQNAADHGLHVSIGSTTDPLSDSLRVWLDKCKFIDNGTTTIGGNGGSGAAVTCKYLWASNCYAEGNVLAGFKFTGSYVWATSCTANGNNAGGFTTGFDSVTEEGMRHVYTACEASYNGNLADDTQGGDGFRHQGQVDRVIMRDCSAVGNTWSGVALVATVSVKPTRVDIYGGEYSNNGKSFTASSVIAGSGIALLSTNSSSVPETVRIVGVTAIDTQGSPTQDYGIQVNQGADIFVGDGCLLTSNKKSSVNNAASVVSRLRFSPTIMEADFIKRTTTSVSVTGTTSETDLQSITIPANTLNTGQRYKIRARGTVSGTNGTKNFRLYFGTASGLFSAQAAGDTQEWFLDAVVEVYGVSAQKVSATGVEIGGSTVNLMLSSTSNANAAITCKITGTLGAAGDTATCSSFFFEPIY